MQFEKFKVVFFVPEENLSTVIEALRKENINSLGEYKNCMSWSLVESTWMSGDNANPYNGVPGETTVAREYRVEFLCEDTNLKRAVQSIRDNHPYEEVEIDIYPIIYGNDLL